MHSHEAGFTLVETIVAFAIMSLTVVAAIRVNGEGSGRARVSELRTSALIHAQSQLAFLGATGTLAEGESGGRYEDGFIWKLDVQARNSARGAGPALVPYNVRIEVSRPGEKGAAVALATVLLAQSAPTAR